MTTTTPLNPEGLDLSPYIGQGPVHIDRAGSATIYGATVLAIGAHIGARAARLEWINPLTRKVETILIDTTSITKVTPAHLSVRRPGPRPSNIHQEEAR